MRLPLLAAPILLLAACGGSAADAGVTVRDSSGITIVTSTAPAWTDGLKWQVDTVPALEIGDMHEGVGTPLFGVTAVRQVADGRIVVSSSEEKTVITFDAAGKELRRDGKEGVKPGEYRNVVTLGVWHDSLVLWDAELDRLTVLDPKSGGARVARLAKDSTSGPFGFAPIDLFADGSVLLAARVGAVSGGKSGVMREPIPLRRGTLTGMLGARLAVVPGTEQVVVAGNGFVSMFERPFGVRTVTAVRGTDLLVATGDADAVTVIDSAGTVRALWRLDRARRAVAERDVLAFTERRAKQLAQLQQAYGEAIGAVVGGIGFPETLPTFDAMLVDPAGALWLRDDVGPVQRDLVPRTWTILSNDGRWLGRVTTPARLQVHQVTADRVLGVWRNDKDVEFVRSYRLRR